MNHLVHVPSYLHNLINVRKSFCEKGVKIMRRQPCGPKVLSPIIHPTKCCVKHTFENVIVPEVFPTHTTNVHNTNYEHVLYHPHTESMVNEVSNTVTNVPPMNMGTSPMGMNPGPMGMNPGPMGMDPSSVMGMNSPGSPMGMSPCCGNKRPKFPF